MLNGVHLTLLIGPAVPVPVPHDVLDALTAVQVTTSTDGPAVFQLTFTLSTRSPLHTLFLVSSGTGIPMVRVIIVVTMSGTSEVLMDGVMTNHELSPGKGPGQSTLTVTGEDLTRVMDYIDFSGLPYPAMPPEARVLLMLAKYAVFGVIPNVIPSVLLDVPIIIEQIPGQKGTDLEYINLLADEVGYVFYIEPGPAVGTSVAYWGPEVKFGIPQPALNVDMDAHTNVETLSFSYNSQAAKVPVAFIQEQVTKIPVPVAIPSITPLNPPLGLVPPIPLGTELIEGTAKYSPVKGALIALAKASRFADVVTGSGTLDSLRYGRVLKARRLVGVRGAGIAFDGLHYVKSVTHKLERGSYKQDFYLVRNALVSNVQGVPA